MCKIDILVEEALKVNGIANEQIHIQDAQGVQGVLHHTAADMWQDIPCDLYEVGQMQIMRLDTPANCSIVKLHPGSKAFPHQHPRVEGFICLGGEVHIQVFTDRTAQEIKWEKTIRLGDGWVYIQPGDYHIIFTTDQLSYVGLVTGPH